MSLKKRVVLVSLILAACGASFNYKYYGLELDSECYNKGTLLGKTKKDDLPFKVCAPDDYVKGKCVVMLVDDFFLLKKDFQTQQELLRECQKRCR